ncbi:MAG: hypothetical protein IKI61_04095 [Erysipelotrichaceae bacterium]|nr:hypothetical protein [Erysipelotrichaceae bacterium]
MNMIRTLAGLFIVVSVLPISVLAYRFTGNIPFEYSEVSDELCINQLREIMLISYDLDYAYDRLSFIYQNKEFTLSEVNEKLILQPGTQIYLTNFDEVHFERKDGCIYVCYSRKGQHYERILCKQSGIHIDDFSDCALRDAEHNSGEE